MLAATIVGGLGVGAFPLGATDLWRLLVDAIGGPAHELSETSQSVIWQLRGPRVVAAAVVGAGLAASGLSMQSVFRNPLAAPDLLGVSAGAALGAVIGIYLGWPLPAIQAGAFAGGLGAAGLVYLIGTRLLLRDRVLSLVLAGIAIGSLLAALIALLKTLADPVAQLPAITFWLLGSFASVGPSDLGWLVAVVGLGIAPMLVLRWRADALALSDDEVRSLGIGPASLRAVLLAGAALATAACVAAAGVIGWVGLVIPHAARLLVGASFAGALPVAMLLGAILMVLIDAIGRATTHIEIPPGVLTALLGAPALFALMLRRRGE